MCTERWFRCTYIYIYFFRFLFFIGYYKILSILLYAIYVYLPSPAAAAAAKLLQVCPTLRNPMDCSPPGSPVPGILQATTLEWVAISFSNAWKWKVKGKSLSRVRPLATPWTAAYEAPPPMGFSRQEYWNGMPSPSLCPPLGYSNLSGNWIYLNLGLHELMFFFFLRMQRGLSWWSTC